MIEQRICIVGLGLMGGSLAKALKGKARQVIGVDSHAATRQQALADGVVQFATADTASGLENADLVVLATPVQTILQILDELASLKPEGCFVLDFGSTKMAINQAMAELPEVFAAVGGHPMCGKETAGYQAADPALFQKKLFVLTRNARTTLPIERGTLALVKAIGGRPFFMPAEEHDQLVAAVSHLPYILSASLVRALAALGDDDLWRTSASGFRDMSRLAGSDPQMLLDILVTNRTAVLQKLHDFQTEIDHISQLLETGDYEALTAWLTAAQGEYLAYRQAKQSFEMEAES